MTCEIPIPCRSSGTEAGEFQDGDDYPAMIQLPCGEFIMGENAGDKFANDTERPSHIVKFRAPFALAKFPVTVREFAKFSDEPVAAGEEALPVVRVSWDDATAYCEWLTLRTGRAYRLPSEAEWEFACRAGSRTPFSTGNEISVADANFLYDENGLRVGIGARTPVDRFPANQYGFHDLHGNVNEWVADSWHRNYNDAPKDGAVWNGSQCTARVIRGGAWDYLPRLLRSSWRDWRLASDFADNVGFRVATSDLKDLHLG